MDKGNSHALGSGGRGTPELSLKVWGERLLYYLGGLEMESAVGCKLRSKRRSLACRQFDTGKGCFKNPKGSSREGNRNVSHEGCG